MRMARDEFVEVILPVLFPTASREQCESMADQIIEKLGAAGYTIWQHRPDAECYYCHQRTNSYAGNPGEWPLHFCHRDEPGKVKAHHVSCVTMRLIENGGHERNKQLQAEKIALENFLIEQGLWARWEQNRDRCMREIGA